MADLPDVVGWRQSEALERLRAAGWTVVRLIQTRPPKTHYQTGPVEWRVICQRQRDGVVELVVTPEWLPFRDASENGHPAASHQVGN